MRRANLYLFRCARREHQPKQNPSRQIKILLHKLRVSSLRDINNDKCLDPRRPQLKTLGACVNIVQQTTSLMRKLTTLAFLGFASGLPVPLFSGTLQAWLRRENVSLEAIGALSLVGLPYVFRFLWAPLFYILEVEHSDIRNVCNLHALWLVQNLLKTM